MEDPYFYAMQGKWDDHSLSTVTSRKLFYNFLPIIERRSFPAEVLNLGVVLTMPTQCWLEYKVLSPSRFAITKTLSSLLRNSCYWEENPYLNLVLSDFSMNES